MKRPRIQIGRDRFIPYAVLAIMAGLVYVSFMPGHIGIDSLSQIYEADSGDFTNRHAALLLALWRPFFELGLGLGFVLAAQILTFVVGGYLLARSAFARLGAASITAVVCLWPPVFGMLGSVQRDTWFAALLLLSYGLIVRAAQRDWPARGRWIALAAVAIWLALASRQNAAPALLPGAALLSFLLFDRFAASGRGWSRLTSTHLRRVSSSITAAVVLTVAMAATQVAGMTAIGARDVDPEQYLYIYDLAAVSAIEEENVFPADVMADRTMAPIDNGFSVDSMIFLVFLDSAPIVTPLEAAQLRSMRDRWVDVVTSDFGRYLEARTELFGHQLALARSARVVFIPDVAENPYGYRIWAPAVNSAALDYLALFTVNEVEDYPVINGGVLYSVWIYLLIAGLAMLALLRRGGALEHLAVGALAAAAITTQTGLFVGAMGAEFRFEFPAVAAAMFAAPVAVAVVLRNRTSARSHQGRDAPPAHSS